MLFRNVSPLGLLEVPVLGTDVAAGETVEIPTEIAHAFAPQAEVWEPADDEARAVVAALTAADEPTPTTTAPADQAATTERKREKGTVNN